MTMKTIPGQTITTGITVTKFVVGLFTSTIIISFSIGGYVSEIKTSITKLNTLILNVREIQAKIDEAQGDRFQRNEKKIEEINQDVKEMIKHR